jgi:hypothetical protein
MWRPRVSPVFFVRLPPPPPVTFSFVSTSTRTVYIYIYCTQHLEPADDHEILGSPPRSGDSADGVDGLCVPYVLVNATIFQGSFHVLCGGRSRSGRVLLAVDVEGEDAPHMKVTHFFPFTFSPFLQILYRFAYGTS